MNKDSHVFGVACMFCWHTVMFRWERLDLSVRFRRSVIVICAILNAKQQLWLVTKWVKRVDRRTKNQFRKSQSYNFACTIYHSSILDEDLPLHPHCMQLMLVVPYFRLARYHFFAIWKLFGKSKLLDVYPGKSQKAIKSYQSSFSFARTLSSAHFFFLLSLSPSLSVSFLFTSFCRCFLAFVALKTAFSLIKIWWFLFVGALQIAQLNTREKLKWRGKLIHLTIWSSVLNSAWHFFRVCMVHVLVVKYFTTLFSISN